MNPKKCVRTLQAGDSGTKKLCAEYGAKLVAVRYRVDTKRKINYKTVELIVSQNPVRPKRQKGGVS